MRKDNVCGLIVLGTVLSSSSTPASLPASPPCPWAAGEAGNDAQEFLLFLQWFIDVVGATNIEPELVYDPWFFFLARRGLRSCCTAILCGRGGERGKIIKRIWNFCACISADWLIFGCSTSG